MWWTAGVDENAVLVYTSEIPRGSADGAEPLLLPSSGLRCCFATAAPPSGDGLRGIVHFE